MPYIRQAVEKSLLAAAPVFYCATLALRGTTHKFEKRRSV